MKTKNALLITGSLSKPSKMPGWSYGLPAWECKTGSKLRLVPNSVCSTCYALKGNYARYSAIKQAQYRRLKAISHPLWVKAMTSLINSKKSKYFRWHDAGDVQHLKHLAKIFKVCRQTPTVSHWLPTREAWLKKYVARAPRNLTIRFSAPLIDQQAQSSWPNTSTVSSTHSEDNCPAFRTDKTGTVHTLENFKAFTKDQKKELDLGHCGNCRKCWNSDIKNITYGKH